MAAERANKPPGSPSSAGAYERTRSEGEVFFFFPRGSPRRHPAVRPVLWRLRGKREPTGLHSRRRTFGAPTISASTKPRRAACRRRGPREDLSPRRQGRSEAHRGGRLSPAPLPLRNAPSDGGVTKKRASGKNRPATFPMRAKHALKEGRRGRKEGNAVMTQGLWRTKRRPDRRKPRPWPCGRRVHGSAAPKLRQGAATVSRLF